MLSRIPEPELMLEEDQAQAYATADFSEPHQRYIELCRSHFGPHPIEGWVLDLGCGPGDITLRFARSFPKASLVGVDGSPAMLRWAIKALEQVGSLSSRIQFVQGCLPQAALPDHDYAAIISNSLLHHLREASALWQTIRRYGRPGTQVCIMDLRRPATEAEAQFLADTYSGNEPAVLKRDFYNSLRAAFTPEEVAAQLRAAGLETFAVTAITDRHLLVRGRLQPVGASSYFASGSLP
jgi:ubiquinone/menaquinone biosynthesis C-methylase UbiE